MQKYLLLILLFAAGTSVNAQKKPLDLSVLDHSVYDAWQSIGEKLISNDGSFTVYTITPQEGDGKLIIQSLYRNYSKGGADKGFAVWVTIERGYAATITDDGLYVICKIKPTYAQTREAKIKKKKADEMPKDSLAIFDVKAKIVKKIARIKSVKVAEKNSMVAWLHETEKKKEEEEGTLFCLYNLATQKTDSIIKVTDYLFDKSGKQLAVEINRGKKDSILTTAVLWHSIAMHKTDTLLKGFTDAKAFAFDEAGTQLAFVVTNDTTKAEQKNFALYHFNNSLGKTVIDNAFKGIPTAWRINENANLNFSKSGKRLFLGTSPKLPAKDTSLPEFERVSVDVWHYNDDDLQPMQLKNLDVDLKRSYTAMFDITANTLVQLGNKKFERISQTLEGDGNIFYTSSDFGKRVARQWQGFSLNDVYSMNANTGKAQLIAKDFKGNIYPSYTGKYLLLYDEVQKQYRVYNSTTQQTTLIAKDITYPLYDEENDVPDDANAYGVAKWIEGDKYVLIYDRYDVWKVDPDGKQKSVVLTNGRKEKVQHRYFTVDAEEKFVAPFQSMYFKLYHEVSKTNGLLVRNIEMPYKHNFESIDDAYYNAPDSIKYQKDSTKMKVVSYILFMKPGVFREPNKVISSLTATESKAIIKPKRSTNYGTAANLKYENANPKLYSWDILGNFTTLVKAKNAVNFIYTMEDFSKSPNLYTGGGMDTTFIQSPNDENVLDTLIRPYKQLTNINEQQAKYNWGTAELIKWKAYTGKETEGVLYKPEDFDAKKKYPMIVYFYERSNNTLHNYIAPSPTPSRLNISFFVSRGYIVFVPDIWYKTGKPGQSAYDYIVSGTRAVVKLGFVDSTKIGLQGQSWGGYQIAHLITRTNLYAAAWAGAPVANMTSAYGGIRWGSGMNRQFQYEKTQSRIGATLWERQDLYIENSPLFHLPKVKTPLVIMHNDKDDAVPWYQGIELFTGLRRLNKKVWMLNYNDELHNLVERKNRKDIQIREQQFFDWLLKGEKPAPWLSEGVPATMKGRTWGL